MVLVENNQALTTSLKVAEVFEKDHGHILRDVRNLINQMEGLSNFGLSSMFIEGTYTNQQNKQQPMYYLNRDGFTLLAMGFTGQKALEFKLKYIAEFNRMEAALKGKSAQQKSEKEKSTPKVNDAPKENLSLDKKIDLLKYLVEQSPNDEVKIKYLEQIAALII